MAPFRGIFTIPTTPFKETGEIDEAGFRRVIDFCVNSGAHGLVYPVNASEFFTLTDAERMHLSEVMIEQNAGRVPTVIGVAGVSREVAMMFAKHAREIGADSVIAMPPYANKAGVNMTAVYDYYVGLAEAAQIPVWIQNNMPPIGIQMTAEFLLKMCREIEYIDYIKEETIPSPVVLQQIMDGNNGECLGVMGGAGGRYLIEEYRRGSTGNMPGCHVTDVVVQFWNALDGGDEERAMRIYKEMAPLFFFEHQLSGCYKEVLFRRGVIDCPKKRNGKMPLDDVSSKYLDDILKDLEPIMTWGK
ncbi:MAG: dihydrodipicolinate synthase family protein [Candidatus Latescibacteria bacterium]|nr:dihydrodipicolinate synthase family protein [Candidatus Latescibacterota bacterium]